jgi:hypothetical protein
LGLVCKQEKDLHNKIYFPTIEKLQLLHSFCHTGVVPQDDTDTFVKEVLKYRLLDIVAFVHGIASEGKTKEKGTVRFVDKLVCLLISASPSLC